jgi:redox-sensitive bicupin YhaK (pirin superfamily)
MQRKIAGVYRGAGFHWVGDGFRVMNYFPMGNDLAKQLSPFVMLDYHAPFRYDPTETPRGVDVHPHRGFETVTLAFEGKIAHHDSAGNAGVIGQGDVQWMTAASGVLHKEYHEREFARVGGRMHMAQIWVNLPKAHKMEKPRYQSVLAAEKGKAVLPDGAGEVRVIAGEYRGAHGPAKTYTPINMFEIDLNAGGRAAFSFPARQNTALLVMDGTVTVNGSRQARELDLVVFENEGEEIEIAATGEAHLLLLNGDPIDEPMVQHGPFVMNTTEEIRQAFLDFRDGKFGSLPTEKAA